MGELENGPYEVAAQPSKTAEQSPAEQRLEYLGRVCNLIENGRYRTSKGAPCVSRTAIFHDAKLEEPYVWALNHQLLEETLIKDASGKEVRVVTFTEQAKLLLYLSYIANQHRRISTFEKEFIRKSTLDFCVVTSGLPAGIKEDLENLYESAVQQGFLQEPGEDQVNGDGTKTCRPGEKLDKHLEGLFFSTHPPQNPQPPEEPPSSGDYMPRVQANRKKQDPGAFVRRVYASAREDPRIKRISELYTPKERVEAQPSAQPEESAPANQEVVHLGLQEAIDEQNRLNRLKAQLAEQQAKKARGLLSKVKKILGS